jgi:uncharacterized protein (DUF697 family)
MAEAIASALVGGGTVLTDTATSDPRLRGLEDVAQAALRVALLRRSLRARLAPRQGARAGKHRPSATKGQEAPRAGGAFEFLRNLLGGAAAPLDTLLGNVPGADFAILPPCNIAVAGRSGAGKSTLLNAVFGRDLAATGIGRAVTREATWYEQPGFPLKLLDTRGLERGDFSGSIAALEAALRKARSHPGSENQLHLLWLCLDGAGRRIEASDRQLAAMAERLDVPLIVVITKSFYDGDLPAIAQRELPSARAIVPVIAEARTFAGGKTVGPMGLDRLLTETLAALPEAQRAAAAAAQRVLLEPKVAYAREAIHKAAAAAALAATTPIPLSDAILIAPIQLAMIVAVARRMGVQLDEDGWKAFAAATAGPLLAAFAGRAAAGVIGNLLKTIPGIGMAAGGAINAAVARQLTMALGEGFLVWLTGRMSAGRIPSMAEITDYLRAQLPGG